MVDLQLAHTWQSPERTAVAVPQLFALLGAIGRAGSVQHAARELDISYRHAWGLITSSAELFGAPLVKLERGRGTTLTAFGEALLELDRKTARELASPFERLEQELAGIVNQYTAGAEA